MLGSLSLFMYLWEALADIPEHAEGDIWNKKVQGFLCRFFLCVSLSFFHGFVLLCLSTSWNYEKAWKSSQKFDAYSI